MRTERKVAPRLGLDNDNKRLTLFKNPIVEFCTFSHPVLATSIWAPIGLTCLFWPEIWPSVKHIPTLERVSLALAGCAAWGLAEYGIHRWIFHFPANRNFMKRLIFVLHGCHHVDPQDRRRNMMPLIASIPIGSIVFCLAWWLIGIGSAALFFGAFALTYLAYDVVHFALHQFTISNRFFCALQNRHRIHHHQDARTNYATLSTWVDALFNTVAR